MEVKIMNRIEVKNLLRRRKALLEIHNKLDKDSKDSNNSSPTINIYKSSRNNISNDIYNIDKQLLKYANESPVGVWLLQIKGMTPDIAAGLLAYFDINGKDCAAQFIKYSGVDNRNNPHNNDLYELMDDLKYKFKSEPDSLYGRLNEDKFFELLKEGIDSDTAHIRADRYMNKKFVSHLFEEMYREEHDGEQPFRNSRTDCEFIEPEVPYTK
jgi:carbonic anhydrase